MACLSCRHKKVRCDLMRPSCSYCRRRELLCQYEKSPPELRKRAQRSQSPLPDNRNVRARSHYPCDIRQQLYPKSTYEVQISDGSCDFDAEAQEDSSIIVSGPDQASEGNIDIPIHSSHGETRKLNYSTREALGIARTASKIDTLLDDLLMPVSRENLACSGGSRNETDASCLDSGPAAGVSVLRLSEMKFASGDGGLLKDSGFREEVTSCEDAIARIRQSFQELTRSPMVYPSDSPVLGPTFWDSPDGDISKYIDTFFDSCQVTFPVVRRQSFDEAWKENAPYTSHVDVPWSLLCYSILALGAFTSSPAGFHLAKEEGMKYFRAALDLQGILFITRPNLMAVQAFLVLTMFAQMIGSPELVYRCSSQAVHTASYVQLQKREAVGTNNSVARMRDHERVFWIVYIFDKCHSLQIGVCSAIDDAQVTQPFPSDHEEGIQGFDEIIMGQLRSRAQLSTIYSAISHRLYSASSLHSTPQLLLQARNDLCCSLTTWVEQIPSIYQIRQHPFRSGALPSHVKPVIALILRAMYQNALLSIHRRFSSYFEASPNEHFKQEVVETSDRECLRAARQLILLLDRIETGIDVPYWFLTYHLLISVVLVFYSVVRNPCEDSVKDDVALIHIATGAFARLKYSTSGHIAISGINELPQLAEQIVDRAKTQNGEDFETHSGRDINFCRVASLDREVPIGPLACTPICPSNMHFSPADFPGLFDTTALIPMGWDADELFVH